MKELEYSILQYVTLDVECLRMCCVVRCSYDCINSLQLVRMCSQGIQFLAPVFFFVADNSALNKASFNSTHLFNSTYSTLNHHSMNCQQEEGDMSQDLRHVTEYGPDMTEYTPDSEPPMENTMERGR